MEGARPKREVLSAVPPARSPPAQPAAPPGPDPIAKRRSDMERGDARPATQRFAGGLRSPMSGMRRVVTWLCTVLLLITWCARAVP